MRVVVGGAELDGLDPGLPAASVRLLLPPPGEAELSLPSWNGNEFLQADGSRPTIRTLTPRHLEPDVLELAVEVVLHDRGPLSAWARAATAGNQVAVSGTGRGYSMDPAARSYLLAGDESAIPAIRQLLDALGGRARVDVVIEIAHPDARLDLACPAGSNIRWVDLPSSAAPGEALVAAVTSAEIDPGARVWAAGEAAAVQRIRKHLFDERGIARSAAVVRGYWKQGRRGEPEA